MALRQNISKGSTQTSDKVEYRIYGCDESAGLDNADDSSGDDDEDKRAAARVSAPRKVYHLDREHVLNKGIMDVAYVFYRFVTFYLYFEIFEYCKVVISSQKIRELTRADLWIPKGIRPLYLLL